MTRSIARCSEGHLFSTIWIPLVSFKAIRIGSDRWQKCPLCRKFRRVSLVDKDGLSAAEVEQVRSVQDSPIP